jgi:type VI secretion system protein ImpL
MYLRLPRDGAQGRLDPNLITRARDALSRVGASQRYYDTFVTALEAQLQDETGPSTDDNLKYPPITLQTIFADRPEVLAWVKSAQGMTGKWAGVRGPYTFKAHEQVMASLADGVQVLEHDRWVLALAPDDGAQKALDRVRQDYEEQYGQEWTSFFRDLQIDNASSSAKWVSLIKTLSTVEWPFMRLLRVLAENTQFDEMRDANPTLGDGGIIDQIRQRQERRARDKGKPDPVPGKFRSMVRFGYTGPDGAALETPLMKYIAALDRLRGELQPMADLPSSPPNEPQKARAAGSAALETARALLVPIDLTGQELLEPLLVAPLEKLAKYGVLSKADQLAMKRTVR